MYQHWLNIKLWKPEMSWWYSLNLWHVKADAASMWNKEFLWFETLQKKDFILERANGGFWASYSTKTTYLAESLFVGLFNGLSWSHGQAWLKNVGPSFQVSLSAFAALPVELPSPHTPTVRVLHLLLCDGVDTNLQTPIGFRDIYNPCKHQCSNNPYR